MSAAIDCHGPIPPDSNVRLQVLAIFGYLCAVLQDIDDHSEYHDSGREESLHGSLPHTESGHGFEANSVLVASLPT